MNPAQRRWALQRLVFLFPLLCLAASAIFFAESVLFQMRAQPAQGEVVRVYEWDNDNRFFGGDKVYGPVFRYIWSDGKPTDASTGQSFSYRFKQGERFEILFDPKSKGNVRLTWFEQLWALPVALLAIGVATLLIAGLIWAVAIRPRIKRAPERRLLCLPASDGMDV